MSFSETYAESVTFTFTHARHIGAKVATDLRRIQRLYKGLPSDGRIAEFESEIVALLKTGYLDAVTYGYKRDGGWIEPTLRYAAQDLAGGSADDDDPGRVRPGANIERASFYSFLTYSQAWHALSQSERSAFEATLPFVRGWASEPAVWGYLSQDRSYSAGGRALIRASVRSY